MGQSESHAIGPTWPMSIRTRLDNMIVNYDTIDESMTYYYIIETNVVYISRLKGYIRHDRRYSIRQAIIVQDRTQNRQIRVFLN